MPHKQHFYEFLQKYAEEIGIVVITIFAVIGRAIYTDAQVISFRHLKNKKAL